VLILWYRVVEAPDTGWGDPQTIALLAGSAALLGAFALVESRHPAPLVPLRFLPRRSAAGPPAGAWLVGGQVRAPLARLPRHGRRRLHPRAVDRAPGRLPPGGRARDGAHGRRGAHPLAGVRGRQLLRRHLLRVASLRPRRRAPLRPLSIRG